MPSPFLATYGTLMRAFDYQAQLGIEDQLQFVDQCQWQGQMYDLGSYPGAVPDDGTVYGELFRLESPEVWSLLDAYEGYNPDWEATSVYVRRQVSLQVPDRTAWVYWYNGDPSGHPRVASGDWRTYVEADDAA